MSTTVSPLFHELVAALEDALEQLKEYERDATGESCNCQKINAALAKAKSGQPLITVSPSMIDAAQNEFIAQWRLGASPDGAVSAAFRAAVNYINNSIKERGNEQA